METAVSRSNKLSRAAAEIVRYRFELPRDLLTISRARATKHSAKTDQQRVDTASVVLKKDARRYGANTSHARAHTHTRNA